MVWLWVRFISSSVGVVLPSGSDVEGVDEPIGDGSTVVDSGVADVGDADGVALLSAVRATASAGW
jgi:hypothetical protein